MNANGQIIQASAVAIGDRALLIEGPPGSGKSSLALALIDRGAKLIGDDAVRLSHVNEEIIASPPPNIAGKLEIRGVGIVDIDATSAPLALILSLVAEAPRYPEQIAYREVLGCRIPVLPLREDATHLALRAEWGLRLHGIGQGQS